MTVLVIEDDPDQLTIRAMLLRENGFEVLEASSYDTAMELALGREIHCAVVDLRLPSERDGLRLIRDLKGTRPAIGIYVLTGSRADPATLQPELALAEAVHRKGGSLKPLLKNLKRHERDHQDV